MHRLPFLAVLAGLLAARCLPASPAAAKGPVSASVSVCFVPGEDCAARIIEAISSARHQIRVQAYGFTSPAILGALAGAHHRGVDVQVILDRSNDRSGSEARYSGATYVANVGVPVWIDTASGIAHNKLIVIDGRLVIGGSFNFTKSAQIRNVENVTFIDSSEIATWYLANWASRRAASYRFDPSAEEQRHRPDGGAEEKPRPDAGGATSRAEAQEGSRFTSDRAHAAD
jgi:phospholipase D